MQNIIQKDAQNSDQSDIDLQMFNMDCLINNDERDGKMFVNYPLKDIKEGSTSLEKRHKDIIPSYFKNLGKYGYSLFEANSIDESINLYDKYYEPQMR